MRTSFGFSAITRKRLSLAASLTVLSLAGYAGAVPVLIPANADVETREATPEFTRGISGVGATHANELTLNNNPIGATNRNVDVVRFSLPSSIQTAADLENYAELRLYLRSNNTSTGQPGSIRVYGVNPAHPLNTTWDETNTFYRDAGTHQNVGPSANAINQALVAPSVISQPANPTNVSLGVPATPLTGTAGYGANSTDSRRAPGIRYEAAPFSANTEAENVARYNFNVNLRAQFDAGSITTGTYMPYLNQPGYNVAAAAANNQTNSLTQGAASFNFWSDVPVSNRPLFSGPSTSWIDDVEDSTFLGFSILRVASTGNYEGNYMSFGNVGGLTAGALAAHPTLVSDEDAARQALVNFLAAGLANGYRDFTFLIGSGIAPANGGMTNEVQNNLALNFASKEYTPLNTALGGAGSLAPVLIVAPEPGSVLVVAGMGLATMARRRRAV